MTDNGFKTVPNALRNGFSSTRGNYVAQVKALVEGKTLFMAGVKTSGNAVKAIRTNLIYHAHDQRLISRQTVVDGEEGVLLWLELK